MFGKLLGFELKYHIKSVGFWVTFTILFLLGLLTMSVDFIVMGSASGERIHANGANLLATQTALFSIALIFFAAIFVVGGLMRDYTYKTLEIVHATPVSNFNLIITRIVGVVIATFLCVSAADLGLFVGQFVPWMDKEALGPVHIWYFVYPLLIFTAVNALFVSSVFALIAATTRSRAMVYVSAVGLLILYFGVLLFMNKMDSDLWTSLAEPFGLGAHGNVTQFWPPAEQNARLLPLFGYVGMNRLLWLCVGLVFYALSAKLFVRGLKGRKTKTLASDEEAQIPVKLRPAPIDTSMRARMGVFFKRSLFEYRTTIKSIPFIILTLIAVAFFIISIVANMVVGTTTTLPTSAKMISTVLGSLAIPLLIIIVFFGGDLIWRDRASGMHEILDASPVGNLQLMAAKWLAMIGIVITLLLVGIGVGMIAQILLGDIPVHPATYFMTAFMQFAPRMILMAILAMFIQNFMPGRISGMIAAGVVMFFFLDFVGMLPFYHPLMNYGSMPTGPYSEMSGFRDLIRFKWFGVYWGSLAALMGVVGVWMWRRGTDVRFRTRVRLMRQRMHGPSLTLGLVFLTGFVGTGAYIFKSYNIDEHYRTAKQAEKRAAYWEKQFGALRKLDPPKVRAVDVKFDLDPDKRTVHIKGQYEIENTTGAPLKDVYLQMPVRKEGIKTLALAGARRVTPKPEDGGETLEDFNTRHYRFDPPLAVGAKTTLDFDYRSAPPHLGRNVPFLKNGTFVNSGQVLPHFGVGDHRLHNPDKRRKYGLPELEKLPAREDMHARQFSFFNKEADYVDYHAVICTAKEQIPFTPGKRIRTYERDGKACREYRGIRPLAAFFSYVSARYALKTGVWQDKQGGKLPLEIYYHKPHDYNVDLMMEAMKTALSTYTDTYGPYPYAQLRILEFPYGGFAQSFASTISFSENIGFVQDPGDPKDVKKMDLATFVALHEIGHQWFGHQIIPARTKGFNVLSEGLTQNAAMTAYEKTLGWKKARRLLQYNDIEGRGSSYLLGRVVDAKAEPPLAKAEEQGYLVYGKASWVFWGMKHYIGEDKIQGAVRRFLKTYGYKGPPYPTTKELVAALRAVTPEDMQGLITDYWERIVFWELKPEDDIKLTKNPDGSYHVNLTIDVDKKIADEKTGKETSVKDIDGETLSEWVEIGFYDKATNPKDTLGGDWLSLERVHVTKAKTNLSFDVPKKPAFLMLDPRRLLIERNVRDNIKKLNSADTEKETGR